MDPDIYKSRVKFKSLPEGFTHEGAADYQSNWEYTKTLSTYHFDPTIQEFEGEWWHKLGSYANPDLWLPHVPALIEQSEGMGWSQLTETGQHPGFKTGKSPTIDQENYDKKTAGLENVEYTQLVMKDWLMGIPVFKAMADYWALENMAMRAHVQKPGQSFAMHIDKLWHRHPQDPSRIVRIMVMLTNWQPGQFIMYGNSPLIQWKAGDIHTFDTLNVPHCTANLSRVARPILIITGLRTSETDYRLLSSNHSVEHQISV